MIKDHLLMAAYIAVQVSVRDERRFAMLFQSVVLPCHYTSVSSQTPVIQWWYKSYCRDRSRDAFRFPDTLAVHGSELGSSAHLDCGDSGRTVRIVASGQGSSITLAEHYKGRDISIINSESQLNQKSVFTVGLQQTIILIID
uniref:Si:zfos-1011f11.2 n=1 Tax=Cyprinus carpio TaxID=7962 RepID=A0A8C2FD42_CYPCA